MCSFTTLASQSNSTTDFPTLKAGVSCKKALTVPVSSPKVHLNMFLFLPLTISSAKTLTIKLSLSSAGLISSILVQLMGALSLNSSLLGSYLCCSLLGGLLSLFSLLLSKSLSYDLLLFSLLGALSFLSSLLQFLSNLSYLPYLSGLSSLFLLGGLSSLFLLGGLSQLFLLGGLSQLFLLGGLSSNYLLGGLSSLFLGLSLFLLGPLLGLLFCLLPCQKFLGPLGPLSGSLCQCSEMLQVWSTLMSRDSLVILPKISSSKEMKFLMNFLSPFLMAMTLPFWMWMAFYPLKKALATAVSSPTRASTIWIFCPSLVSTSLVQMEMTLTQTLYPLLTFSRSLTLTKTGLRSSWVVDMLWFLIKDFIEYQYQIKILIQDKQKTSLIFSIDLKK